MRLKVIEFGSAAEGIRLTGDPKSGEPDHVRIAFPGGDVEVVRSKDGADPDYWIHIRIDHPDHGATKDKPPARIVDARLDLMGQFPSNVNVGDFGSKDLYHLAVRIEPLRRSAGESPKPKQTPPSTAPAPEIRVRRKPTT